MASFVSLGFPLWTDGMNWTSLLSRQFDGGVSIWDSNASLTAVSPLGGVFHGPGSPLLTVQQVTPAMSVLVNAGYVAVPHPTAQHGVYLFGLQDQATLTIASNSAGSARYDLIVARVYDTANSSSYCDIEVVEGDPGDGQPSTPSAAFLLAVVEVPSNATSVTSSDITDKRTFTCAPGGILATTTAAAPPLGPGQVVLNTSLGLLQRLAMPITYTATFTASGSWISPVSQARVRCWGDSGGGGGGFQDYQNGSGGKSQGGAGGGGGEYAEEPELALTPGHTYNFTIGTGGEEGHAGTNNSNETVTAQSGTAGTGVSFPGDAVTVTANPGQGGEAGGTDYPNTPGAGGTGSTNTIHEPGGSGGAGSAAGNYGAGGGGGAPGTAAGRGGDGQPAEGSDPGSGGAPADDTGGDGGDGAGYGGFGESGGFPGAGGGGGWGDENTYWNAGGAGAGGLIVITWTVQPTALTPVFSTDSADEDLAVVNTSTGATGLTTGGSSNYGWGIGGGTDDGSFDADDYIAPEIQVTFDADGSTDFQFDAKWGLAVPEAAVGTASPSISRGQCRIILQLDGKTLDQVYLRCSATGGVTSPGDGGCWTYYTSAQRGDTPSSGTHTLTLAIETFNTLSGSWSGAHIGDLASVGTASHPFGGSALPSYFTNALTAENCSLRVAGITAAVI